MRRAIRAERAQRKQAERERARREEDDVLAHDDLAGEHLALDTPQAPPGLLRRLAQRSGSGGASSSVLVEIFAPTRHDANLVIEAQRLVGAPARAPSDPPFLEPVGTQAGAGRYRGRVVIRRPRPIR